MYVKTVHVTYERKFNLGDYNSATIGASAWADLDEGESEVEAHRVLFAEVKDAVREQAKPLFAKAVAQVEEMFAGLPVELRQAALEAGAARLAAENRGNGQAESKAA